jgi:Fe-S oxidoreductase
MAMWVGSGMPYEVHVPPLGLMYLASYARRALDGVEFRIIESSLHSRSDEEFVGILEDFKPDVVGIRSILFFLDELRRIAGIVRSHSDAAIIVGGPIVGALRTALFPLVPEIDVAVKGEGEAVFTQLLSGLPPAQAPGVIFRSDGEVFENPDAPEIADIDSIPFPAYDLVDLNLYARQLSYAYNHRRQGVLLTSRGCSYDCTFCFNHWRTVRVRSAESVFEEIQFLVKDHGIEDFYIVDDIFNINLKRALAIFEKIASAGLKVRLYFANGLRADTVTEEFVDRAIDAGAIWFTYAVESASEDIQTLVRKEVNLEKARKIIGYTQRKGVAVNVSTMFGFPTETLKQAQQTLDWLSELPKPSLLPYHFCLRLFPGCEITQQAADAGWDPARLNLTSRFSYNDLPMGTPTLPKSDMFRILLDYHNRFGLNNRDALRGAVQTLQHVGYVETDIAHMYSVLKRKVIHSAGELLAGEG